MEKPELIEYHVSREEHLRYDQNIKAASEQAAAKHFDPRDATVTKLPGHRTLRVRKVASK